MKYKTKPYAHQAECLERFGGREAYALLAEMGTGKTWIIINDAANLYLRNLCDSILVLAPNGVHVNWTRIEIPKHIPDDISYKSLAWTRSKTKTFEREYQDLIEFDGLKIFTMNWEALQSNRGILAAHKFADSCKRLMIVCDESDSIKNPRAKRTKALFKLKQKSHWRRILTGTPINNSPFDAFSQYNFLDEEILHCRSFYAFKAEYALLLKPGNPLYDSIAAKTRFTPQVVARKNGFPVYRNLDKLAKLILPHSFRILKEQCLDLPDKIYKNVFFELTPQQKRIYKKARDECRIILADEEKPIEKLTAIMKLAQITSGFYIHPFAEDPVRIEGPNPKIGILGDRAQAITDAGNSLIIWARFRAEISDIAKELKRRGVSYVEYHGGIPNKNRAEVIDAFMNKEAQVFLGNQKAGGKGLTLTAANYVIYFSNDFSLSGRLQSEDRAHRIGQEKDVTYINLIAKDTIDETILLAIDSKRNLADLILERPDLV